MKLRQIDTKCETNMPRGTVFSIKQSAAMFKILSSGLYSNKEKAVIREVSCNAVDANIDAGNGDIPIIVHLPNTLEPFFSIKDSGTGLDDEQMNNIYTQYGNSTKSDRNDQIGALGLGSKSPFSYIDSFSVISITNGTRRSYTCFIDGSGEPQLVPFGEDNTDERNGIEVMFPVKSEDFKKFRTEAEIVFRPFRVKPTVVGNSSYEVKQFKVLLASSKGEWELIEVDTKEKVQVAVQGNIEYPINTHIISEHLSEKAKVIFGNSFRLHFPIGDLDIAASREELGYDKVTIVNICSRLEDMVLTLEIETQKEVNKQSTLYLAREYLADLKSQTRLYDKMNLVYKKTPLDTKVQIRYNYNIVKYSFNYRGRGHITRTSYDTSTDTFNFSIPISKENSVYIYIDDNKKTLAVTKARSLANRETTVYLVSDKAVLDILGNPGYLKASEIELSNSTKSVVVPGYKGSTCNYFKKYKHSRYKHHWFENSFSSSVMLNLDETKDFFYIGLEKGETSKALYDLTLLAVELDIIKDNTPIYGVSSALIKTKKFSLYKGIELIEFIKDRVSTHKKVKVAVKEIQNKKRLEFFLKDNEKFINISESSEFILNIGENNPFKSLYKEYLELKSNNEDSTLKTLLTSLHYYLGFNFTINESSKELDAINEKYPLISKLKNIDDKLQIVEYIKAMDMYNSKSSNHSSATNLSKNKKAI